MANPSPHFTTKYLNGLLLRKKEDEQEEKEQEVEKKEERKEKKTICQYLVKLVKLQHSTSKCCVRFRTLVYACKKICIEIFSATLLFIEKNPRNNLHIHY